MVALFTRIGKSVEELKEACMVRIKIFSCEHVRFEVSNKQSEIEMFISKLNVQVWTSEKAMIKSMVITFPCQEIIYL